MVSRRKRLARHEIVRVSRLTTVSLCRRRNRLEGNQIVCPKPACTYLICIHSPCLGCVSHKRGAVVSQRDCEYSYSLSRPSLLQRCSKSTTTLSALRDVSIRPTKSSVTIINSGRNSLIVLLLVNSGVSVERNRYHVSPCLCETGCSR